MQKAFMLMELKWKRGLDEKRLEILAKEDLLQVESKNYDAEMRKEGIEQILKLGIAFSGKKVVVQTM